MRLIPVFFFAISSLLTFTLQARSPAVLPGVEIESEHPIQKDLKNARGRTFLENRPHILTQNLAKKKKTEKTRAFNGLMFFMTLMLPGTIAWIIIRKAHHMPSAPNLSEEENEENNVIPLNIRQKDDKKSKAS